MLLYALEKTPGERKLDFTKDFSNSWDHVERYCDHCEQTTIWMRNKFINKQQVKFNKYLVVIVKFPISKTRELTLILNDKEQDILGKTWFRISSIEFIRDGKNYYKYATHYRTNKNKDNVKTKDWHRTVEHKISPYTYPRKRNCTNFCVLFFQDTEKDVRSIVQEFESTPSTPSRQEEEQFPLDPNMPSTSQGITHGHQNTNAKKRKM